VSILGRKRWRDLWRQKAQVAAVALTIGLGLAGFVAARDAYLDLRGSLDHVYSQLRFADLTVTGGDPATIVGAIAYTTLAQYAAWTGTTPAAAAGAVALRLRDGTDRAGLVARYAVLPDVAAILDVRALQRSMTDAFSLYNTLVVLMGLIGAAMAGALLYTTASANITERYVELGSLRAAGMGAGMLGRLAAAENLLLAASATVPGVAAGWLLARAFMAAYSNDQMRMTLQLRPLTLPLVAALVLTVAAVAQLPALRGIRRTDIARVVRERSV
jgi:predicted lysophospholipase L1 biosynthesis ABC-type transport system permease subunit